MKFYIHLDSYEKLTAHLGDKIESLSDGSVYDVVDGDTNIRNCEISIEDANDLLDDELAVILRRNGMLFGKFPFPPIQWEEIE